MNYACGESRSPNQTAAELSAAPLARVARPALSALPPSRFVHFVRFTLETLISIVRNALILSCGPGSVLFGPSAASLFLASTSHARTWSFSMAWHFPAEFTGNIPFKVE